MKNLHYAIRQVLQLKPSNFVKLISLTLGFAVASIFATRVAFEQSFDSFFPNLEQLYKLEMTGTYGEKVLSSDMVMAPLVKEIASKVPAIASGTCIFKAGEINYANGDKFYDMGTVVVDSSFFDVLDFGVISGNANQSLNINNNAFISKKYAEIIFGTTDPIGKSLKCEYGIVTICGVFNTIPNNCHLKGIEICIGNPGMFPTHWDGGDSFRGYFKLHKGATAEDVNKEIPAILEQHMDVQAYREQGITAEFFLFPVSEASTRYTGSIDAIMSILAFVLIAIGALNYVLLTISSLASRAKEIGVHKASGASAASVFALVIWETFIYIILSVILGAVLLYAFRLQLENVAGSYTDLFSVENLWSLLMVIILLFLISGVIPAWLFSRVPVSQIFRRYTNNKNRWKQALLFIQFGGSAVVLSFLLVIIMQHGKMVGSNVGYNYDNVAYTNYLTLGDTKEVYMKAADEISRLPFVRKVSLANSIPIEGSMSGLGVTDVTTMEKHLLAGQIQIDDNFFDLFEIPIIRGRNFNHASDSTICIFDQAAQQNLIATAKVDNALGYSFYGDGNLNTIGGIVPTVKFSSYHTEPYPVIYRSIQDWENGMLLMIIKFDGLTADKMKMVDTRLRELFPGNDFKVMEYSERLRWQYSSEEIFRNGVGIAAIVLIIITIAGVTGYIMAEIRRRSREIAIRRVHGSSATQVIALMLRGICMVCLIGAIVGVSTSYLISSKWLEVFTNKTELYWWIFMAPIAMLMALVAANVVCVTRRISMQNPANYIKSE